jgi:sigma-B regulation protein RsbU (phosphoserine phosphatase)
MSAVMQPAILDLRTELSNWKQRLEASARNSTETVSLDKLLREVTAAIDELTNDGYGMCQVCHDLIGQATMNADPLARFCLSCLSAEQLEELGRDLDRAWLIQGQLLPKQDFKFNGWEVSYRYEAAGPVSGDYCDLVNTDSGDLYFLIGDVSGKGIAASFLMARLHAIFRSLIAGGFGVRELVARANEMFAENTMRPYYATLVCGKASANGEVEVCNAGHCAPLLLHDQKITPIDSTGLPIGMFARESYSTSRLTLGKGDRLLLYTDGLSEARDDSNAEYGDSKLEALLRDAHSLNAAALVARLVDDVRAYSSRQMLADDLTIMAIEMVVH